MNLALSIVFILAIPLATAITNPQVVSNCKIPPASTSGIILNTNILYATMDGQQQKLDIAYPSSGSNHSMVIAIHGGGWNSGDKSHQRDIILRLAQEGYVAASINYRLAPSNKFPAAVEDARCAVRFMKANAATFRGDSSKIVAIGGSAGGQIAGMLAFAPNENWLDESGDCSFSGSPAVDGAALYYGATDLRASSISNSNGYQSVVSYLGADPVNDPALAASASPITFVDSSDGPVYMAHRTADPAVPFSQSQALLNALHATNVPATLVSRSDPGHGFEWITDQSGFETTSCSALEFLKFVFGTSNSTSSQCTQDSDCTNPPVCVTTPCNWIPKCQLGQCNYLPAKQGDANFDNKVDIFDLSLVASNLGKSNFNQQADLNGDGTVNLFDLVEVARNFGT